jgi:protein TonB
VSGANGSGVSGAIDFIGKVPPPPAAAKQGASAAQRPIRVASSVQEAKLIHKVIPIYPKLALETRQQGKVRLAATVGKDGRVNEVRVLSGPSFLAAAAVEAVKQWCTGPLC